MNKVRASEVFVPGGLPEFTYVSRGEGSFEERLRSSKDSLCKLVTVTGATKSGKTVLTQRVFPRSQAVWIDGGSCDTESDLWDQVVEQLGLFTTVETGETQTTAHGVSATMEGKIGVGIAGGKASATPQWNQGNSRALGGSRSLSSKSAAIHGLRQAGLPLVIDDFHYLRRPIQGSVVRGVKALVFEGHPVVFLAIPHRRYDAVRVEREMTGRVESIGIPSWERDELLEIPSIGFELLNMDIPKKVLSEFASESLGSPHLMQDFCRRLCAEVSVTETLDEKDTFAAIQVNAIYQAVARGTSKTMFDRLARGPRQRSDRKQRSLRDGSKADIYLAILLAIAKLDPGMETLEYEAIRSALKDVLEETPPQAHEVSRVLKQMAQIAADDESSTPVIDWEEDDRRLHVTDPFFAFYLKWGLPSDSIQSSRGNGS